MFQKQNVANDKIDWPGPRTYLPILIPNLHFAWTASDKFVDSMGGSWIEGEIWLRSPHLSNIWRVLWCWHFFCSRSEWQFSQTLCFSRMQSLASSLNRSWTAESRANQRSVDHLSSTSAAWAGTRRPRPLSRVLSDLESLKDKERRCVSEYKGLLFFTNDSQDVITYFFPQDKRVFQTTQRLSTLTRYAIYAGHASEVVMSDWVLRVSLWQTEEKRVCVCVWYVIVTQKSCENATCASGILFHCSVRLSMWFAIPKDRVLQFCGKHISHCCTYVQMCVYTCTC